MLLPDWIVDDILAPADPSAIRLVLALFRHGSLQTAGDGSRRVYWRGSRMQLARIPCQNKKSVNSALAALGEAGFLSLHESADRSATVAFSVPLERPGNREAGSSPSPTAALRDTAPEETDSRPASIVNFCGGESVSRGRGSKPLHMHGGGDPYHSLSTSPFSEITTSTMTREELFSRLTEEGVTNPGDWMAKFDHGRIEAALDRLDQTYDRDEAAAGVVRRYGESVDVRYSITNPAGFLYELLRGKGSVPPRAGWPDQPSAGEPVGRYR